MVAGDNKLFCVERTLRNSDNHSMLHLEAFQEQRVALTLP